MAYIRCDLRSESMKMTTSLVAILPEDIPVSEARVVFLLHGLSDNCTGWTRYTAVERYARENRLAVIMPEVQRSFYTDMIYGLQYFRYIQQELPQLCNHLFGVTLAPEKSYIMGLSMGGYGALKCTLQNPSRYAGCGAFSAVTDLPKWFLQEDEVSSSEKTAIFGLQRQIPAECDLYSLLEKTDADCLPTIYLVCGEQDGLYSDNVRFAQALQARHPETVFEHWCGLHEWAVWDRAVARAFAVLLKEEN